MANTVGVDFVGNDKLTAVSQRVNREMNSLGKTFSQVGNIAANFGNTALTGMADSMAQAINSTEKLGKATAASRLAFLGLGAAAYFAGDALAAYLTKADTERNAKRLKEITALYEIQNEANVERLSILNDLAGKEARINRLMQQRIDKIRELKEFTEFEKSTAVLDVQKAAEAQIFEARKKNLADLQALQQSANEKYMAGIQSVTDFEQKKRDETFKKYIEGLDEQIRLAEQAKQTERENMNALAEEQAEIFRFQNSGLVQMMKVQEDLWTNSLLNMKQAVMAFSANAAMAVSDGIGNAFASIATGARTASQAFSDFGKAMLGMLVKTATQMVVNSVLAISLQSAVTAAAAALGATVAASWAAAAALVSLATFGANAAPANAAILSTAALSKGVALGGQFHSGTDYVPREGSYNLKQGEMVIDPGTSEEVRENMLGASGGRGGDIYLEGIKITRWINDKLRDGSIRVPQRALVA